jgi:hypothetical protein
MEDVNWDKVAGIGVAIVLAVILYFAVAKPLLDQSGLSNGEVGTACAGIAAGSTIAMDKWKSDGRVGDAIKIAAAMGLASCASTLKSVAGP